MRKILRVSEKLSSLRGLIGNDNDNDSAGIPIVGTRSKFGGPFQLPTPSQRTEPFTDLSDLETLPRGRAAARFLVDFGESWSLLVGCTFVGFTHKRSLWRTVRDAFFSQLKNERARHEEGNGCDERGETHTRGVGGEEAREGGTEGEVTVPRADFHELRNRWRTARPWHRLPLIFYCPSGCVVVGHDVRTRASSNARSSICVCDGYFINYERDKCLEICSYLLVHR